MITVHKLDHLGHEKIAYTGEVIERTEHMIVVVATFTARDRMELDYVTLMKGDTFVEYFYTDRWYNVFAIFDANDKRFKGWYCNLTRSARFESDHIWAEDLALDYFVQSDGTEFVLDEDEFATLGVDELEAQNVRAALAELQSLAARREGPFSEAELARVRPK